MTVTASDLRYVLSAGRTGTVYLSNMMNRHLKGVTAAHEPDVSRYQMMAGNIRNEWGIGADALRKWFNAVRSKRLAQSQREYVEINPMLCPITDLLPMSGHSLRIVHLVRDPASWAASILAFRASVRFRSVIDLVPFATPYPVPRPSGWTSLSQTERALWRWRWCNSRIADLKAAATAYAVVRYEDVFSANEAARRSALQAIIRALSLPTIELDAVDLSLRTNPAPETKKPVSRKAAGEICGAMAREFGYDY